MKPKSNFRARNLVTGETCEHHHHTVEKARGCILHRGWNPNECVIEEFDDRKERKCSIHHKDRQNARGTKEAEF